MIEALHWSGPIITLAGVLIGAYATMQMCREYHPFNNLGVIRHLFWIAGQLIAGKQTQVQSALATATAVAQANPANRYRTLAGVYLLVFSFFIQTIGALLIVVDLHFAK